MKKLSLIGSGQMAEEYVRVLKFIGTDFNVVSTNHDRIEYLKSTYGVDAYCCDVMEFKSLSQEFVINCVDIPSLFNINLFLLNRGVENILSEKPVAFNLAEVEKLSSFTKSNFILALNRRFYPSSQEALKILLKDGGARTCSFQFNERTLDWDHPYYKEFYNIKKNFGVKIVSCCYDLIPVLYPQYCVNNVAGIFTSYFLEIADGSDMILCISNQSQKDLNEMLEKTGGAQPLTHVFPLGDNIPEINEKEEISEKVHFVLQQRFILFVSTIERRKNHEVLYRAYHLLCRQGKKSELPKLVFVGMPGWGVGELLKYL
jgi:glycosyltransferase involved in cell wall biosynthesis